MLQDIKFTLHSRKQEITSYNQTYKAQTIIQKTYSGYQIQDDENQFLRSISQVNTVLIPSPWNNPTVAAKHCYFCHKILAKNPADPVFQKSNNEKIKSCGAFPLSALFMNSQHSMKVIKIPYVRTTHSTRRYELAFHRDNAI